MNEHLHAFYDQHKNSIFVYKQMWFLRLTKLLFLMISHNCVIISIFFGHLCLPIFLNLHNIRLSNFATCKYTYHNLANYPSVLPLRHEYAG
jgi:hypothetical protein